jgi:hypothetical protein
MWSDALAEAPWDPAKFPKPWEKDFRKAYAQALVDRGPAFASKPAGKHGGTSDRGETLLIEKKFRTTPEELEEHARRMEKAGEKSWNNWARKKLLE